MTKQPIYGLMAEFGTPEQLIQAAERAHAEGYRRIEACSPFPIEGLAEACGFRRNLLPLVVLIGGIVGGSGGFFMQWFANVIHYPLNIGGRPHDSWPAFIIITFELTILCAALSAVFGMLAMNGLPTPYHPVFNVPRFEMASTDRFFLSIEARDKKFDLRATKEFLQGLGGQTGVFEVER